MYSIVVCGDRRWSDREKIYARLDDIPKAPGDVMVITGGARGADTIGHEVAGSLGYRRIRVNPDWKKYGRAAGPIRNARMLKYHPDLVIAFHSNIDESKGTMNCIRQANAMGIRVELIP